jgi:hypothetical protein
LYCLGGIALSNAGGDAGDYWKSAIQAYRNVRVDYLDIPLSSLGYLGEARVHRLKGDAGSAGAVLATLMSPEPKSKDTAYNALHQIVLAEQAEIDMLRHRGQPESKTGAARICPQALGVGDLADTIVWGRIQGEAHSTTSAVEVPSVQ